ncbi:hypothetical protein ACOMHN_026987 [Nucella lapillus]
MVCVCRPLPAPSSHPLHHLPLGGNMFISRHDMRMAYTYCDPRVQLLIGYDPRELLGHTVYQFHNPVDAHKCSECHNSLIKTGRGVSQYYRHLGKTGVWVWMQTTATIVTTTRGRPQYVVCNNYIISQKEGERTHQMELQQQQQSPNPGRKGLVPGDLVAKGVLDLPALTQATSPVSVTDSEHEQHGDGDTGYSSGVSSANTSPCPLGALGVGGGDLDLDLDPGLLLHADERSEGLHHPQEEEEEVGAPRRDSEDLEASLGLESATELGFHSTLSSAIYGEFGVQDLPGIQDYSGVVQDLSGVQELPGVVQDLPGVHDLPASLDSLTGSVGPEEDMAEDTFGLVDPLPSGHSRDSDPFLCEAGGGSGSSGRGRGEGSLTHVMEDMEVLDTLLQDMGRQCQDSGSHDAVFPASPLPTTLEPQGGDEGRDTVATTRTCVKSVDSLIIESLVAEQPPECSKRTPSGKGLKEPPSRVLSGVLEAARLPSLLRTLLDKEGEAVKACHGPVTDKWTTPFPAVSPLSKGKGAGSDAPSQKGVMGGSAGKPFSASKRTDMGSLGGEQQQQTTLAGSGLGQQLMLCGDKQVLVPREVDLTKQDSDEEGDGEGLSPFSDDVNMQSVLPEDLMDFAMQYCDPGADGDGEQASDLLAEVDVQVWSSMDHLMAADTPPCLLPQDTSVKESLDKVHSEKQTQDKVISEKLTQDVLKVHKNKLEAGGGVSKSASPNSYHPLVSSPPSRVIQSDVVSSTRQDSKPTITIIRSTGPGGKTQPLSKDKMAAILKLCAMSSANVRTKVVSPALSDHKYSSTLTLSPTPASRHPPSGKRMRTHWDKGGGNASSRDKRGLESGDETCSPASDSSPSPMAAGRVPDPSCRGQGHGQGQAASASARPPVGSPRGITSPLPQTLRSPSGQGSSSRKPTPSSQPTSPLPAPIPINGGGKPLTAMSELEKHLRGLVAPPDERKKDSGDPLLPLEEGTANSGGGSGKPFLELLLTGEISHERYRQIDYHLLYQERERRLEENGHSS